MTRHDHHTPPICPSLGTGHALHIVTNPDQFHTVPAVLQSAWAELKAARGQTVNLDRMGEPAYLIAPPPAPEPTRIGMKPETLIRLHNRARLLNWLRGPNGGDAA
jgi:hypothetical protein